MAAHAAESEAISADARVSFHHLHLLPSLAAVTHGPGTRRLSTRAGGNVGHPPRACTITVEEGLTWRILLRANVRVRFTIRTPPVNTSTTLQTVSSQACPKQRMPSF